MCAQREWNANFRAARSYQAYPDHLMEPSLSRWGSVCMNVEAQNAPKGYPVRALFIEVISPSPDAAGLPHCIITMLDVVTKYTLAHPIINMMLPQMEVSTIVVHIWDKWVKHFGFPRAIRREMRPNFEMAFWVALCRIART